MTTMSGERIVVIDGGIDWLASAALLARDGHRVTLLEALPTLGGRAGTWERRGFRFDTGPSWYLMPEVFDHFFRLFGTSAEAELDLITLDPGYRAYGDGYDEPIDLRASREQNVALFESIEPGAGAALDRYLDSAASTYDVALSGGLPRLVAVGEARHVPPDETSSRACCTRAAGSRCSSTGSRPSRRRRASSSSRVRASIRSSCPTIRRPRSRASATATRAVPSSGWSPTEPTPPLVALLGAFFCWGMASHAFGAVQDVVPDREAGIASIATALGARATVRLALGLWFVAGLLMLATEWPGPLAALLVLPYLVAAWPYRSVSDAESGTANQGWRRFIALNHAVGFLVTMLLIWWALVRS